MAKSLFAEGIKEVNKMPDEGLRNQERQAASIFLSALMSVETFRITLFEGLGLKVGQGSRLSCLSNFSYLTKNDSKQESKESYARLNNMFYMQTTKFMWSALVVTRVGGVELEAEAVAHCAKIAKQIRVNAVLTICDQFTARINILPVEIEKSTREGLEIFHLSWGRIYIAAKQVLIAEPNMPADDRAILSDFIGYMESETKCLSASSRLLPETSALARLITSGAEIDPTHNDVVNVVASWHENLKFLSFKLRDQFNCDVSVLGSDLSISQAKEQLHQDARRFSQSNQLLGSFSIAKGNAVISLKVDLLRRTVNYSMVVNTGGESYKSASHLSLLLEKLRSSATLDIYIKAIFTNRAAPKQAALESVMKDHSILDTDDNSILPDSYEVLMVRDIANNLEAMDLLVEQIDDGLFSFYEHVAQNLSAMVSPRELGPLEKTKQFDAALVKAVNENIDTGGPQATTYSQRNLAEGIESVESIETEETIPPILESPEEITEREAIPDQEPTVEDQPRDFSADLLVDVLGKLDSFKHR